MPTYNGILYLIRIYVNFTLKYHGTNSFFVNVDIIYKLYLVLA